MKTALVGYTGFVGSNLVDQFDFSEKYNSSNITKAFETKPDLLIYAGIRAEKFLANKNPAKDMLMINDAINNIKKITPKQIVLISTIDVYQTPLDVNEYTCIKTDGLLSYGANRYFLEKSIRKLFPDTLIVRLPGLYGKNIKKNFIYDFIHRIPSHLSENKFFELLDYDDIILKKYYELEDNGFYKCNASTTYEKNELCLFFKKINFSALNFTDSRSIFQFYPLSHLWADIITALNNNIKLLNIATEPISVNELYYYLTGCDFQNHFSLKPLNYNMKTVYDTLYGGNRGYICDKTTILKSIKQFIQEQIDNEIIRF